MKQLFTIILVFLAGYLTREFVYPRLIELRAPLVTTVSYDGERKLCPLIRRKRRELSPPRFRICAGQHPMSLEYRAKSRAKTYIDQEYFRTADDKSKRE